MIKVRHLSRRYGDFVAVDDVSFDIPAGEIVGLLGHNGAGKTTIMKMLTGFLEPTAGEIRIDGHPLEEHAAEIRARMGYLPESPPIYPDMTVFDYLEFAAELKGVAPEQREEIVMKSLLRTDLGDKAASRIGTLSRGYRQRVGVAQALLNDPDILILDEPTNGLDPTQIEHMRTLIRSLREHATIILSTHIMQEVTAMCDRVLMLRQGIVALDSSLEDLRRSNHLLLKSSASLADLDAALSNLPGIQVQVREPQRYAISLDGETWDESRITAVAHALSHHAVPLQALHPEVRDLETVFKEINSLKEPAHAE